MSVRGRKHFAGPLLGLALMTGIPVPAATAAVSDIDRIVAVVNDDVIVRSELDYEIDSLVDRILERDSQAPSREAIERQVLDRLILKKLQLIAATQAGITVTEDVLAQAVGNIAKSNNMRISDLRRTLEQQGVSLNAFRRSIREQIMIQQLQDQEILKRIRVTEQEVDAYLSRQNSSDAARSEYHLLHILVASPEEASPEQLETAREKAEAIVARVRGGADFQVTALTESDGRQALEGGDLGWRPADQIPTLFIQTVTGMERGAVSDPVKSPSGYHIIKLVDFKGGEKVIITQTKARHILISTNEVTSEEVAKTRLSQLKSRIESGEDFEVLARSNSEDKSSAIKGGNLGWITPGDLLPEFEEEMNLLAPNEISAPFQTDFGWHIVQVLERRNYDSTEELQRQKARLAIRKRKLAEEGELYLRRLKDEAFIEIRLDQ